MKTIHSIIALLSTFVPFMVVVAAIVFLPNAVHTMANVSGIEWIYLIAIGAMTLGSFYWLVELDVAAIRERLFKRLDVDHDGYIRRADVAKSKDLIKVFDENDTDHDGRLSRIEFSKALTSCGRLADFESYIGHLLSGKSSID